MHSFDLTTSPVVLNSLEVRHTNGHITEIGLATLDTSLLPTSPSKKACISTWLQRASFFHFRITDNARHLASTADSHPTSKDFQFGNTRWITLREAQRFLEEAYSVDDGSGVTLQNIEVSPSICLCREALRSQLGFDILDVSLYMPVEIPAINIPRPRMTTGSTSHVGNTAAQNLSFRIMQLWQQTCIGSQLPSGMELLRVFEEVKEQGRALCHPGIGVEAYCVRCRKKGHEEMQCREKMYCGCGKMGECGKRGSRISCPKAVALGDGELPVPRAVEAHRRTGEYGGRAS